MSILISKFLFASLALTTLLNKTLPHHSPSLDSNAGTLMLLPVCSLALLGAILGDLAAIAYQQRARYPF